MHPYVVEYMAGKSLREIANANSTNPIYVRRVLNRNGVECLDPIEATRAHHQNKPTKPPKPKQPKKTTLDDRLETLTLAIERLTDAINNRPSA